MRRRRRKAGGTCTWWCEELGSGDGGAPAGGWGRGAGAGRRPPTPSFAGTVVRPVVWLSLVMYYELNWDERCRGGRDGHVYANGAPASGTRHLLCLWAGFFLGLFRERI
jgi:hypothetical protein